MAIEADLAAAPAPALGTGKETGLSYRNIGPSTVLLHLVTWECSHHADSSRPVITLPDEVCARIYIYMFASVVCVDI